MSAYDEVGLGMVGKSKEGRVGQMQINPEEYLRHLQTRFRGRYVAQLAEGVQALLDDSEQGLKVKDALESVGSTAVKIGYIDAKLRQPFLAGHNFSRRGTKYYEEYLGRSLEDILAKYKPRRSPKN